MPRLRPSDYVSLEDELWEFDEKARQEVIDRILERNEGKIKSSHIRLRTLALDLATMFDNCSRVEMGGPGEYGKAVMLSDVLTRKISAVLRAAANATD